MSSRSTRLPWLRSGLMGLVAPLLPLVWVMESSSCSGAKNVPHTGVEIVSRFEADAWPVLALVLLLAALTPVVARYRLAQQPDLETWAHVLGLAACGLQAYGAALAIFFTVFAEREATAVGVLVLALFGACVVDALLRVAWSAQAWRRAAVTSS